MQETAESAHGLQRQPAPDTREELRAAEVLECAGPHGARVQTGLDGHASEDLVPKQKVGAAKKVSGMI